MSDPCMGNLTTPNFVIGSVRIDQQCAEVKSCLTPCVHTDWVGLWAWMVHRLSSPGHHCVSLGRDASGSGFRLHYKVGWGGCVHRSQPALIPSTLAHRNRVPGQFIYVASFWV